jgi:hypothetical protein
MLTSNQRSWTQARQVQTLGTGEDESKRTHITDTEAAVEVEISQVEMYAEAVLRQTPGTEDARRRRDGDGAHGRDGDGGAPPGRRWSGATETAKGLFGWDATSCVWLIGSVSQAKQ